MNTKPLSVTNPYLKDPDIRARLVAHSVKTSCEVEGIDTSRFKNIKIDIPRRGEKKIYKTK